MSTIRQMQRRDHPEVIELWHSGWHEAHATLVPLPILHYRSIQFFRLWLAQSTDRFFVASDGSTVTGFVAVNGHELVKLYVARMARGTGLAGSLLRYGEQEIANMGFTDAELYCTAGNRRAETFYSRQGWKLAETFQDGLWVPRGVDYEVYESTHRFVKRLP